MATELLAPTRQNPNRAEKSEPKAGGDAKKKKKKKAL